MKTFSVTMDVWRESFSGRDYHDYTTTRTVQASNADIAKRRAEKLEIGGNWSQARWTKNVTATEVKP